MTTTNTTTDQDANAGFVLLKDGVWGRIGRDGQFRCVLHFDSRKLHVRDMMAMLYRVTAAIAERSVGDSWVIVPDNGLECVDRYTFSGTIRFEDARIEQVQKRLAYAIATFPEERVDEEKNGTVTS